MHVHPDQPTTGHYDELKELLDYERSMPNDYRIATKQRHIQIAEHNEKLIRDKIDEVQDIIRPTWVNLRNQRNKTQLQERVYLKLRQHFDHLNFCIVTARTPDESDYCFNKFETDFDTKFKAEVKSILLDY